MAKEQGVQIPKIHLLIGNRLTQFKGSATAFKALSDATSTALYKIYKDTGVFCWNAVENVDSIEKFIDVLFKATRDFNSAGVVCAHFGRLLSSMKQGYYQVYSENQSQCWKNKEMQKQLMR